MYHHGYQITYTENPYTISYNFLFFHIFILTQIKSLKKYGFHATTFVIGSMVTDTKHTVYLTYDQMKAIVLWIFDPSKNHYLDHAKQKYETHTA